jgi:hypothetical protein
MLTEHNTFLLFLQVPKKRKNRKKLSSAKPSKKMKLDESVEGNSSSPSVPQTGNQESKHEGFQPFDYSQVNFSRFHGGSRASTNIRKEEKPKVS